MDIIHRRGRATAHEVLDDLAEPPSYSAVRALLRLLEERGHVKHVQDGQRYVYTAGRHPRGRTEGARWPTWCGRSSPARSSRPSPRSWSRPGRSSRARSSIGLARSSNAPRRKAADMLFVHLLVNAVSGRGAARARARRDAPPAPRVVRNAPARARARARRGARSSARLGDGPGVARRGSVRGDLSPRHRRGGAGRSRRAGPHRSPPARAPRRPARPARRRLRGRVTSPSSSESGPSGRRSCSRGSSPASSGRGRWCAARRRRARGPSRSRGPRGATRAARRGADDRRARCARRHRVLAPVVLVPRASASWSDDAPLRRAPPRARARPAARLPGAGRRAARVRRPLVRPARLAGRPTAAPRARAGGR